MEYRFDNVSKLWLEPTSVIIDCLFPIEYIYDELIHQKACRYGLHSITKDSLESISATNIPSGSQAEGLSVPRLYISKNDMDVKNPNFNEMEYWEADIDSMSVMNIHVENGENELIPMATVEKSIGDSRYVRLKVTDELKSYIPSYEGMQYLPHSMCLSKENWKICKAYDAVEEIHGPVIKSQYQYESEPGFKEVLYEGDRCNVFKYPTAWPEDAMDWLVRSRPYSWPSVLLIKDIFDSGCHLAPVGRGIRKKEPINFLNFMQQAEFNTHCENDNEHDMDNNEWRISFSVAENKLGQSLTSIQRYVFVLLKMLKKCYFNELICTYHLKNLLFWECEEGNDIFWKEINITGCILAILERLQKCLSQSNLPHYIMPNSNLFANIDSEKAKETVAAVRDVRENILLKIVNLLQKVVSCSCLSFMYRKNMDLSTYLLKVKDHSIAEQDMDQILVSLYTLIIEQSKDAIMSIQLLTEDEDKDKFSIPLYIYESVMARYITKLYFKWSKHDSCKQSRQVFEESLSVFKGLCLGKSFLDLAFEFYSSMEEEKDSALAIPYTTAMKRIEEIENKLSCQLFDKLPKIDWINAKKLDAIVKRIIDELSQQGKHDTRSEDLEKMVNEELNLLHQQSHEFNKSDAKSFSEDVKYLYKTEIEEVKAKMIKTRENLSKALTNMYNMYNQEVYR